MSWGCLWAVCFSVDGLDPGLARKLNGPGLALCIYPLCLEYLAAKGSIHQLGSLGPDYQARQLVLGLSIKFDN